MKHGATLKRTTPLRAKHGFKKPTRATLKRSTSKPKSKRRKKSDRKKLEDAIWEECKRIIRTRYQNKDGTWTCYTTGRVIVKPYNVHTGHGKPKGALPVRYKYDLRNLRPQSFNANINLGGMSDIFIAKLEREPDGLAFLTEACIKTEDGWQIKKDNPMGSLEAFVFLTKLLEEYKQL